MNKGVSFAVGGVVGVIAFFVVLKVAPQIVVFPASPFRERQP